MPPATRLESVPTPKRNLSPLTPTKKKTLLWIAGSVAAAFVIVIYLASHWPFRQSAITSELEQAGSGKVTIKAFHQTYIPFPGCVAEGVVYRLGADASALATIDRLTIQSNWLGLLARRLRLVEADGMKVFVPRAESKEKFKGLNQGSTSVDKIAIRDAVLEVPRKEPGQQLQFRVHELNLDSGGFTAPTHFSARLTNPEPPGEVIANGQFGPWKGKQTPVSGDYTFENADLKMFEGIAGILSSTGKFGGTLEHIDASGDVKIPGFELKKAQHPVALESHYNAYVNGTNGDTFFQRVTTQFSKSRVYSEGRVAGVPGQKGKSAFIDLESRDSRIEDILRLFSASPMPAMAGAISFRGKAILPPGKERFLKKIELKGEFGIFDSKFTRPTTQEKVNKLSENAQRDDKKEGKRKEEEESPDNAANSSPVLSDVKGSVTLKSGVAAFSDLSFAVPGAHARMHGTYNVITEKIDLHGMLKMDSELADSSSGAKSVMLKVLQPFFRRKKHQGSEVPVKISGDYQHPSFGIDVAAAGKHAIKAGP